MTSKPWDELMQEAQAEQEAWLKTLEEKVEKDGIETIIQEYDEPSWLRDFRGERDGAIGILKGRV